MTSLAACPTVATRWRQRPGTALRWRDWGGDSVAFELRSGDTHLLAPLTAVVMGCLETGPHTLAALSSIVADDLACEVDHELQAAVASSVQQLLDLDWIEAIITP